jgi:alpha-methylacyl-CoA racemase
MQASQPLKGIKVLDVSRLLPGSFCSQVLADLGAEVVKIEEPGVGDYYRGISEGETFIGPGQFEAVNHNKKSVALNLKSKEGQKIFRQLVPQFDILVEGFRPRVVKKIGLDYATLKKIHPKIILCSLTGYGQTGPYKDRAGHDLNYIANAGVLSLMGPDRQPPVIPGVQVADVAGGSLYGVISILAALYRRDRTGQGAHLDVALAEGTLSLVGNHYLEETLSKPWPRSGAPLSGGYARYRVYQAKDGHVALAALEPKFWYRFCDLIGHPEWGPLEFQKSGLGKQCEKKLAIIFKQKTTEEWACLGDREEICLSPIWELNKLHRHPHHRARKVFQHLKIKGGKKAQVVTTPIRMTGMSRPAHQTPPALGAHTKKFLSLLGYSDKDIKLLRQKGVVG